MPDTLHARLRAAVEERLVAARAALNEVGGTRVGEMYPDGSGPAEVNDFPFYPHGSGAAELAYMAIEHPAATVRRCEALLRVVERHAPDGDFDTSCNWCYDAGVAQWPCPDLHDLAAGEGIEVGDG